jgi:hypothetical protein
MGLQYEPPNHLQPTNPRRRNRQASPSVCSHATSSLSRRFTPLHACHPSHLPTPSSTRLPPTLPLSLLSFPPQHHTIHRLTKLLLPGSESPPQIPSHPPTILNASNPRPACLTLRAPNSHNQRHKECRIPLRLQTPNPRILTTPQLVLHPSPLSPPSQAPPSTSLPHPLKSARFHTTPPHLLLNGQLTYPRSGPR